MPKPEKKSKAIVVIAQDNKELSLSFANMQVPILSQAQFECLTEKVPPYALKKREDGFSYVASGWVKKKLFDVFGADWSEEIIPIDGDKFYLLREDEQRGKKVRYISVMLRLRVNVRNPKTLEVIATLEKVGIGSQVWRNMMELGDAIKGAKTDAIRNAAFDLGIGFDYKWDDEAEQVKFAEKEKQRNAFSEPQGNPRTLVELLTRLNEFDDAFIVKVCQEVAGVTDPTDLDEKHIADVWKRLNVK